VSLFYRSQGSRWECRVSAEARYCSTARAGKVPTLPPSKGIPAAEQEFEFDGRAVRFTY
jgi:hypothetical protein